MASDDKQTDAQLVECLRTLATWKTLPLAIEVFVESADRLEQYRNEVTIVLGLLDGLAEQWGDEAVFRRCRDRLRELVK